MISGLFSGGAWLSSKTCRTVEELETSSGRGSSFLCATSFSCSLSILLGCSGGLVDMCVCKAVWRGPNGVIALRPRRDKEGVRVVNGRDGCVRLVIARGWDCILKGRATRSVAASMMGTSQGTLTMNNVGAGDKVLDLNRGVDAFGKWKWRWRWLGIRRRGVRDGTCREKTWGFSQWESHEGTAVGY